INYKATEILAKTIIEERQKLIDMKADGSPIKPALWKRLIDGYMSIKPRWKRVALSTMIFLPASAMGAIGAGAIASYGVVGLAGLAGVKFGASMAIGAGVGQLAKGIDWAKKGSDLKFKEKQVEDKQKLKEKFSEGKIDLNQYEKQLAIYEEEERKRNRNRTITKGVVGGALAIAAGFVAYDAMGHGVEHLKGIHNSVDAVTGPDVSNHLNTPNIIEHANVEATADHGQGAISTLRELQHNLKIEYGNDLNNAPVSVKHILNTDAHKLAQEYGMYKPGQDAESAFIKSGSSFRVDSHGNLTYHAVGIKNDLILERGTDIKASSLYEGKMSDTDHSGVKESFKAPEQVDMETGRPIITHGEGDTIKVEGDQFKAPEQVDMETGKPIVPNNTDLNNSKIDLIPKGNSVKFENFNFGNGDHILSLNENGSSLRMQFIYDNHGKIIDVDAVGNTYNTGSNPYTLEGELEKLEKYKRLDADVDIMKMTSNARFLDKLPHNTHEYRFLSEKVAGMQKEIIDNYGNVINPDKLINSPSINISTENLNVDNNLTPEILEKVHTTLNENVKHLFPNEKSMELWNNAKNNVSAERFMELNKGGEVLDSYKPLFSYMDKLEKISGATPIGETLLHKAESMPDYILRATKIIAEKGELDKIKL
ncbi:MAG: hypothetical protein NTV03_00730, partial [Candidatus Nomurabacteria bacterium]|nr:hypothetical protein [Candidatus Nomurabacteria bacterium]